ncbi:MAG: hypothetical protein N2Z72_08170 [Bacteroidales bacterium]|nr:hypothetical protein [Bacteroidales bacterium]
MKKYRFLILILNLIFFMACQKEKERKPWISDKMQQNVISQLMMKYGESEKERIQKGVQQVARFWTSSDGNEKDFEQFCLDNFTTGKNLDTLFARLNFYFENIFGYYNALTIENNRYLHEPRGELTTIDQMFAGYDVTSHFNEDMFKTKIAFVVLLNFSHYSLEEKNKLGLEWDARKWAFARMADLFISRVPAELQLQASQAITEAENYISSYNIYMGKIQNSKGKFLFPKDKMLLSHWGLRDEIKALYADQVNGLEKQEIIYQVMLHIIRQTIPEKVINDSTHIWQPEKNVIIENNEVIQPSPEPNKRYECLLRIFHTQKALDPYYTYYPSAITRKFDHEMEMNCDEVEKLFVQFISHPLMKKMAQIIEKKLNRKLRPFDIWFNQFVDKTSLPEDELDKLTQKLYPNNLTFQKDIPRMLKQLGFPDKDAQFIGNKIVVEPARGSGHAWGAQMRSDVSHLRTRIPSTGMLYKGYNIAIHELGHNVEQTISLHYVPHYILAGVPNTAFTEALAFMFQRRDLILLGKPISASSEAEVLQLAWSLYEIMGVSLVDIRTWKWLYENPEATAEELKNAVVKIAIDVWNQYYAPVFNIKDQPILAIYSHMIADPLYLSAYPIGHIIEFQLENAFKGKPFAKEIIRVFSQGRLTPQVWMLQATGKKISIDPLLEAIEEAIEHYQ